MARLGEQGKRLGSRLTGISTPLVGASWTPAVADIDVARRVLAFLEDRRALYSPYEMESEEYVAESVIEIRRFLTDVIGQGGIAKELEDSLRAMRGASRAFLDESQIEYSHGLGTTRTYRRQYGRSGFENVVMNQALGKLRGLVGIHVALIALRYGLAIEADLATILPPEPE